MSVIGCDDVQEAAYYTPPLTTIAIPNRLLGGQAAAEVHRQLTGLALPLQSAALHPKLVVRASTAKRRSRR